MCYWKYPQISLYTVGSGATRIKVGYFGGSADFDELGLGIKEENAQFDGVKEGCDAAHYHRGCRDGS